MSLVRTLVDAQDVSRAAAGDFMELAQEAIGARGRFTVALSGGSTPRAMYRLLARSPYRERVAWNRVEFFWGDERAVAPDHPDSNYRMAALGREPHGAAPRHGANHADGADHQPRARDPDPRLRPRRPRCGRCYRDLAIPSAFRCSSSSPNTGDSSGSSTAPPPAPLTMSNRRREGIGYASRSPRVCGS
jgi:hypothetical protein